MENNIIDWSFLSWVLPSLIAAVALIKAFWKENAEIDEGLTDQAIKLSDRHRQDAEDRRVEMNRLREEHTKEVRHLLSQIEETKVEVENLKSSHKEELKALQAEYACDVENARAAYEELGRLRIKFDVELEKMKHLLAESDEAFATAWMLYDQLIEEGHTPVIKPPKGRKK
jgi:hypothetical protein